MELSIFQEILRAIASAMKIPVIIILILFIAFSVFCIGWIIVEQITERRHMKYHLPKLLDDLKNDSEDMKRTIEKSGLLRRQKETLKELIRY